MIIVLNELYVLNLTINKYKYITKSFIHVYVKKVKDTELGVIISNYGL